MEEQSENKKFISFEHLYVVVVSDSQVDCFESISKIIIDQFSI